MFCGECGKQIDDRAKFCPFCGSQVEVEEEAVEYVYEEPEEKVEYVYEEPEEEVEYVYEEAPKAKKGNGQKTVIIALLLVIVVIAGVFAWLLFGKNDNPATQNNQTASTEEAQEDTEEEIVEDTEDTEEEEEEIIVDDGSVELTGEDNPIPNIAEGNTPDYDGIKNPDGYKVVKTDEGYSFGVPEGFYDHAYKIEGGYRLTGSDGVSQFEIYKLDNSYGSISSAASALADDAEAEMDVYDKVMEKFEDGKLIYNARSNSDSGVYYYYLADITESSIYTMMITYPYSTSEMDVFENPKNYFIDCMYRYCSFSGTSYKPRTYKQFVNNEWGSKK